MNLESNIELLLNEATQLGRMNTHPKKTPTIEDMLDKETANFMIILKFFTRKRIITSSQSSVLSQIALGNLK